MTPPCFSAYVEVKDYDDDFVLIVDKRVVKEGTRSAVFTGTTPYEAIRKLLAATIATDSLQRLGDDAPVPDGYHHVADVRHRLAAMLAVCASGIEPGGLHWGGNWDVTFHVVAGAGIDTGCHEIEENAELIVVECDICKFHLGVDASYLERVGAISIDCPSCKNKLTIEEIE